MVNRNDHATAVVARCMALAGTYFCEITVQALQFWAVAFDQSGAMAGSAAQSRTALSATRRARSWYRRPVDSPFEAVMKFWGLPVTGSAYMPGLAAAPTLGMWSVPWPAMMPGAMPPNALAIAAFWPLSLMMPASRAARQMMAPFAAAWGLRS